MLVTHKAVCGTHGRRGITCLWRPLKETNKICLWCVGGSYGRRQIRFVGGTQRRGHNVLLVCWCHLKKGTHNVLLVCWWHSKKGTNNVFLVALMEKDE